MLSSIYTIEIIPATVYNVTMYSTREAAEKLGLSQDHVRLLARKGILEAKRLGHDWVILDLNYTRRRRPKEGEELLGQLRQPSVTFSGADEGSHERVTGMAVTKREVVFVGNYLRVVEKSYQTSTGEKHVWETVERLRIGSRGAVVIIALTDKRELILERNWRVPLGSFVIQLPAGLCDLEGETHEEAARRELMEETGYIANKLMPVMLTPEDPVLTPTLIHHFVAPDVVYAGKPRGDGTEEIEVLKVPVASLGDLFLSPPKDTMLDLRVSGILWILERMKLI